MNQPFPTATEDVAAAAAHLTVTLQTTDPAYRVAYQDLDFLLREDMRPVRFQLELAKPDLLLREAGVLSTFVFYGSARIPSPEAAPAIVATAGPGPGKAVAERLAANARYYDEARRLARFASEYGAATMNSHGREYVVCSGGGPSIMEAANRGAADVGAPSIGLNIVLPHEQAPNPYVTPGLSFQFHYFALRKMHFLLRAKAVAVFPGGFGTFDEMFELLTLIQTGKIKPMPVLLFGRDYWHRVVGWEALVEEGVISAGDLDLITWVETAEEAWDHVRAWYGAKAATAAAS